MDILTLTSWYHRRRHFAAEDGRRFLCNSGRGSDKTEYADWQATRHHKMPAWDDIPLCAHCKRIMGDLADV